MPRQLAFDLPVRPALGRDAFFVSPANTAALAQVEGWETWPDKRLLLTGPTGSGKTHLAHVWAALAGAKMLPASGLTPDAVPTLAAAPALALEDLDRGVDETALFHLMNLARAESTALLFTASRRPDAWGVALPDLLSRLSAMPLARLDPPDDALLAAVLVKLFADRQIAVQPSLIDYLLPRIDRSFAGAARTVATLDAAALAARKPITVRFAGTVLDKPDAQGA